MKNYKKIQKSSKILLHRIKFVVEYQSKIAYFHFWFLNLAPPEPIYSPSILGITDRSEKFQMIFIRI